MQLCGLEALLAVNGIELSHCQQALYEALRMQCFAQVCDVLREDQEAYIQALGMLRMGISPSVFAEEMVKKHCSYKLDAESYTVLGRLFCAFFRKDDTRKVYPVSVRRKLILRQNHKCAICGKLFGDMDQAELDHIIPWIYVGDVLADNLQMLCHDCNQQKRASLIYPLQVLLTAGPKKPGGCVA